MGLFFFCSRFFFHLPHLQLHTLRGGVLSRATGRSDVIPDDLSDSEPASSVAASLPRDIERFCCSEPIVRIFQIFFFRVASLLSHSHDLCRFRLYSVYEYIYSSMNINESSIANILQTIGAHTRLRARIMNAQIKLNIFQ